MSKLESEKFSRIFTTTLVQLAISQREAAHRSGISESLISNMAKGQIPSLEVLLRFCHKLARDPHPLLLAAGYSDEAVDERGFESVRRPMLRNFPLGDWRADVAQLPEDDYCPINTTQSSVTDYCLRITDDAMWPALCCGDIVGVQEWREAENERLMLLSNGQQTLLRTLRRVKAGWSLLAHNPMIPPLTVQFSKKGWQIIGRVSWSLRDWLK